MYIQRFQIYKEVSTTPADDSIKVETMLIKVSDVEYITQQLAFKWIDEEADKADKYVILPVIRYDENATI